MPAIASHEANVWRSECGVSSTRTRESFLATRKALWSSQGGKGEPVRPGPLRRQRLIEDRGHYLGTELPDADKRTLIEFLKTL